MEPGVVLQLVGLPGKGVPRGKSVFKFLGSVQVSGLSSQSVAARPADWAANAHYIFVCSAVGVSFGSGLPPRLSVRDLSAAVPHVCETGIHFSDDDQQVCEKLSIWHPPIRCHLHFLRHQNGDHFRHMTVGSALSRSIQEDLLDAIRTFRFSIPGPPPGSPGYRIEHLHRQL